MKLAYVTEKMGEYHNPWAGFLSDVWVWLIVWLQIRSQIAMFIEKERILIGFVKIFHLFWADWNELPKEIISKLLAFWKRFRQAAKQLFQSFHGSQAHVVGAEQGA